MCVALPWINKNMTPASPALHQTCGRRFNMEHEFHAIGHDLHRAVEIIVQYTDAPGMEGARNCLRGLCSHGT